MLLAKLLNLAHAEFMAAGAGADPVVCLKRSQAPPLEVPVGDGPSELGFVGDERAFGRRAVHAVQVIFKVRDRVRRVVAFDFLELVLIQHGGQPLDDRVVRLRDGSR
ncbi:MAG: hypothetical protein WD926_00760 [Patescibacteria group bacterium]